jgi:hypothetical protein
VEVMKIRTIPQEYEAIQFNGLTKEVEEFLLNSHSSIYKQGDDFILSSIIGNQGISIGDYLYKHDSPLTTVSIAHKGNIFDKYFEVIN